jgi:hypothetical protein
MKIIINETNTPSRMVLDGEEYSVDANSVSSLVTDSIAEKWVKTHSFLIAKDSVETIKKAVIKEEPTDEVQIKTSEKKIKKLIK